MDQENILEVFSQQDNSEDNEIAMITILRLVLHAVNHILNIPSPPQYYFNKFKKNLIYKLKKNRSYIIKL
jgi:hypothetical protein